MCGLAGMFELGEGRPAFDGAITAMVSSIRHRGPDADGTFVAPGIALGSTRLAILDLSAAANQPYHDEASELVASFNGEIYNYLELREMLKQRGHAFRTDGDTEVIVKAFAEWNCGAFEKLRGMWAVAIYDRRHDTLYVSRDRLGIKPLYYALVGSSIVLGSEIRALFASGYVRRAPCLRAIAAYLLEKEVDASDETFFEGIFRVPPGAWAKISRSCSRVTFVKYWTPPIAHASNVPYDAAVKELRRLIDDSITLHLRSDVPIGMCLSGGLDSSTISTMAAEKLRREAYVPTGFTAIFPGTEYDEARYAAEVVRASRLQGRTIVPSEGSFADEIDFVIEAQEEPFHSTGVYVQWKLFQAIAADNLKVVLDGQGADEYLGGYFTFYVPYIIDSLLQCRFTDAAVTVLRYMKHNHFRQYLGASWPALKRKVFERSGGPLRVPWVAAHLRRGPVASNEPPGGDTYLRRVMSTYLTRHSLPALLRYEDKNSMSFSVESRVPFLDHVLIEYVAQLPDEFLIRRGETKRILRDAVRNVIPAIVVNRRDKVGFGIPEKQWIRNVIAPRLLEGLRTRPVLREFFDIECLTRVTESLCRGGGVDPNILWRAYNVWKWYERVVA